MPSCSPNAIAIGKSPAASEQSALAKAAAGSGGSSMAAASKGHWACRYGKHEAAKAKVDSLSCAISKVDGSLQRSMAETQPGAGSRSRPAADLQNSAGDVALAEDPLDNSSCFHGSLCIGTSKNKDKFRYVRTDKTSDGHPIYEDEQQGFVMFKEGDYWYASGRTGERYRFRTSENPRLDGWHHWEQSSKRGWLPFGEYLSTYSIP
eukprot:gnl/TRDRNA2_/TRDRNA2_131897_c1_seq1.p1 gnl/TRDRNA2_/TRDRNA2_131897_c1~~gnl/TRDRNA2_/TRDRNA2_131897_c1_seq1.p1  ORF type:complete len:206 (+),score=22.47 gnl/TRDRNA2_/TRDRNA2_131897_c1_seq1:2-619(+)